MLHVDDGQLHAYLDGELEHVQPGATKALEAHLAICGECRQRLEAARAIRTSAHGILAAADAVDTTPPPFRELVASARGQEVAARLRVRQSRRWAFAGAWAASVFLAVGAGWLAREVGWFGGDGVLQEAGVASDAAGDARSVVAAAPEPAPRATAAAEPQAPPPPSPVQAGAPAAGTGRDAVAAAGAAAVVASADGVEEANPAPDALVSDAGRTAAAARGAAAEDAEPAATALAAAEPERGGPGLTAEAQTSAVPPSTALAEPAVSERALAPDVSNAGRSDGGAAVAFQDSNDTAGVESGRARAEGPAADAAAGQTGVEVAAVDARTAAPLAAQANAPAITRDVAALDSPSLPPTTASVEAQRGIPGVAIGPAGRAARGGALVPSLAESRVPVVGAPPVIDPVPTPLPSPTQSPRAVSAFRQPVVGGGAPGPLAPGAAAPEAILQPALDAQRTETLPACGAAPPPTSIHKRADYTYFVGTVTSETVTAGPGVLGPDIGRNGPAAIQGRVVRVADVGGLGAESVGAALAGSPERAVVVVGWGQDAGCQLVPPGPDALAPAPGAERSFFVGRLRHPADWAGGRPTFDLLPGDPAPYTGGPAAPSPGADGADAAGAAAASGAGRAPAVSAGDTLSPAEYFSLYTLLPVREALEADPVVASSAAFAWERDHPELARRYPAAQILEALRAAAAERAP